jgi:4'-phosphopantetheinyl transferase
MLFGPDRTRAFLRIWTLKEAFIKATGRGLTVPLADFAFTLEPFSFTCATGEIAAEWRFRSFDADPNHQLAVAVHCPDGGDVVVTRRPLGPDQLACPGPLP